jgi:hypothetical protein
MNVIFDPNNPIDCEIQKHLIDYRANGCQWQDETIIRIILGKRLASKNVCYSQRKPNRINDALEIAIQKRIVKTGLSRENVIREALCVHFDIPFDARSENAIREES